MESGPPNTDPSCGREEDLNPGPLNYKSNALTTRPRCLQLQKFTKNNVEVFVLSAKIFGRKKISTCILNCQEDLTFIFLAFRPLKRGGDNELTTALETKLVNLLKATIQNVSRVEDSKRKLYDSVKEKSKDLRETDIEGPWPRDMLSGENSDKVIDKDPDLVLNIGTGEGEILVARYLN